MDTVVITDAPDPACIRSNRVHVECEPCTRASDRGHSYHEYTNKDNIVAFMPTLAQRRFCKMILLCLDDLERPCQTVLGGFSFLEFDLCRSICAHCSCSVNRLPLVTVKSVSNACFMAHGCEEYGFPVFPRPCISLLLAHKRCIGKNKGSPAPVPTAHSRCSAACQTPAGHIQLSDS